jgi:hypothetical protein
MRLTKRLVLFFSFAVVFSNVCMAAMPEKLEDNFLQVQISTLKSIPFAMHFRSFDYSIEPILSIASQISLDKNQRLDIPLIELAEYYFGESTQDHKEAASNRGYRMVPKIRARLEKGGATCLQHSPAARKFLNDGRKDYICSGISYAKATREDLIMRINLYKGKPSPFSWPFILDLADEPIEQRDEERTSAFRGMVATLPVIQASYLRSKGKEGWPEWFRTGVFIEVLAREPHSSMDSPLLELRDFSLGPEADASMQRALLYRMKNFPRFAALVQARLPQAPSWLGFPLLTKDVKRIDPSNPNSPMRNIAVEAFNPYGVKALTQAERNVELQKLLVMFKAR